MVFSRKEAAAGRREALEPAIGNKLRAKAQSSKVMGTTIYSSLGACMLLLVLAVASPRALASGNANWGTGVELTAPAGAAEDPEVFMRQVSCASAGNCTVAGSYEEEPEPEKYYEQGMLLSETGGAWQPAVRATMPAGAAPGPRPEFGALSCPSAGNCSAVGGYRDGADNEQGFLLSESAGVWGTGVEVSLPANVGPKPQVALNRLSCLSAGNCIAVGNYTEPSRKGWQGFLVSETDGTWSTAAMVPSLPANASSNPEEPVPMGGVSCTSVGNCTAVGSYTDSSGDLEGFIWTETAGVWGTAVEATPPANATSNPDIELESLSCPSAGNCTAVGEYRDSLGPSPGLILSETSDTWSIGIQAIMPAGARSSNLAQVQCASAGNCTAFGTAENPEERYGVFLTETAGVWGAGVRRPLPAGAESQLVIEGSLSCPAAGDCSYVGNWKVNEFVSHALLVTENDGTWGPGINGALPANATGNGAFLSSVSCTAPGRCTAVGSYRADNGGYYAPEEGMVFTATPTTAFLSASGPLGGAFAGSPISASSISATLAGGSAPSGTITFTVFGPQSSPPSSCTTGGTTVGTGSAYGDGTYRSSVGFTPPSHGDYWWYASYGGDASDEPAASTCGPSMAETTVSPKATPTLSASATTMGAIAGSPIASSQVSATLTEGSAPTGTITFTVFGPQSSPPSSCASGGTTVGTASVNGNGTYQPSAGFTPPSPGEYWWYASYGGDAGDDPAASACGALMAQTLVVAASPTLSVSAPATATAGGPIAASSIPAMLAGGFAPTGTITFTVFGPQSSPPSSCASGGATVGTASASGDGMYLPPRAFTLTTPGDYWWYASYSGDAANNPAASHCSTAMAETNVVLAGSQPKPPAPRLAHVKFASKRFTAKKGVTLDLTVSQPATIEILIAQTVNAHKHGGVCKPTARKVKRCTTEVKRRTLTFSGSAGSNTFALKFAGLSEGSYTAAITAKNANGTSNTVTLTFTITNRSKASLSR